jgi:PAS domain S-box-containing protein
VQRLVYELQVHQVELELQNEELRQAQLDFESARDLYEHAPVGYLTVDDRGVIVEANQTMATLLGVAKTSLSGRVLAGFMAPTDADELHRHYQRVLRTSTQQVCELRLLSQSSGPRDVRLESLAVPRAQGNTPQYRTVLVDITEHKQAEHERHRLEIQLRQVQRLESLGTLAGGIAHEFNNILAGLLGFADLLRHEVPPDSQAGFYVQQVRQAGYRAKELVEQIVTFSRAEGTTQEPLHLGSVVQEALTLLRASLPSTIDIQYHLSEPEMIVYANRTQLHGVIMGLGANADYAMRATGGHLTAGVDPVEVDAAFAAAHPPLSPGPHVCLTMGDTGGGMTPEVMARIFEPFFTTKPVGEGTGMGLAIVHGIVTKHGGAITVESTWGGGARFAIYLPRLVVPAVQAADPDAPLPKGKERVLVVDDEATVALAMQLLLESLGYDVVVHTASCEALAAFRSDPHGFDAVITDQTMPQMTGEDLVHALRRLRPDLPIILCTGFSHVMDAQKAQALGNVIFLMKPVDARELAVMLQQVFVRPSSSPNVDTNASRCAHP